MTDVNGVVDHVTYGERIRAFFALSGAELSQPINTERGDGIWYHLPDEANHVWHGDPHHGGGTTRGFATQEGAMKQALYAMGVDIASDRFTHETEPLHAE